MNSAAQTYRTLSNETRRDELVVENLDFVRHVLGKLAYQLPSSVDKENLESAGVVGLVEAAHKYDHRRGIPFRTFAYPRVRGAILDELRKNSILPQRVLQLVKVIRAALETLPPPASHEMIADHLGISLTEVEEGLRAIRLTHEESWDDLSRDAGNVPEETSDGPTARVQVKEQQALLADGIESLADQERQVLTMYYMEDLRLREIGEVIGLSEARVSRALASAKFRLREYVRSHGG